MFSPRALVIWLDRQRLSESGSAPVLVQTYLVTRWLDAEPTDNQATLTLATEPIESTARPREWS